MPRPTSKTVPRASASATAAPDRGRPGAVPIGDQPRYTTIKFGWSMDRAGPFEDRPLLAVAVSGGADSMALALLVRDWARKRDGDLVALTVDHGLRRDAASEARLVGEHLAAVGITQHILRWRGPKPESGIQAAAREARYALLTGWCRRHGVLHLLLAHQGDDQAETYAMRKAHGSGAAGLAAMPLVTARGGVQIVRPLLGVRHRALSHLLTKRRVAWIEDPSNEDPRFERVRVRRQLAGAGEIAVRSTINSATEMSRWRESCEPLTLERLAEATPMPAGWHALPGDAFRSASDVMESAVLERCLLCVGGGDYPPRRERLNRLLADLPARGEGSSRFRGRTLAGCRIVAWRDGLAICREAGAIGPARPVRPGDRLLWDGRFSLRIARGVAKGLTLGPLAEPAGWPAGLVAAARAAAMPAAAKAALPALFDRKGPVCVPHLGWQRGRGRIMMATGGWRPGRPLAPPPFLSTPLQLF